MNNPGYWPKYPLDQGVYFVYFIHYDFVYDKHLIAEILQQPR